MNKLQRDANSSSGKYRSLLNWGGWKACQICFGSERADKHPQGDLQPHSRRDTADGSTQQRPQRKLPHGAAGPTTRYIIILYIY